MTSIQRQRLDQERHRFTHPLAFHSAATRGRIRPQADDPIRTCYERDAHRILHAKPFRRLRNKTQVFFSPENDHITTRMDHSLYVATISRTLCRALGLNDDLAYAAALGHDLGHSAFGHSGEATLRRLLQHGLDETAPRLPYHHEAQSLRVVDLLASHASGSELGLNLTYEVRDAIRCHCGESRERLIRPRPSTATADPSTFLGLKTDPITLEGCVVRLSDRVAYLGRDYEDALVALGDLPPLPTLVREVLGQDNRQIINSLVTDLIQQNHHEPEAVGFSPRVFEAMDGLRAYNYQHIYRHPRLEENRHKMDHIIQRIFEEAVRWVERIRAGERGPTGTRFQHLAHFMEGAGYAPNERPARIAIDWIALMTDNYAFRTYEELTIPRPVV
ncbi:MAG: HD domain-containing protein [Deltaproteobacteria bacterium]|nr:HD domain-containing protein [Deltaproteobacteria bacterium]